MLDSRFVILGTLIGSAGAIVYLWATIRGRVKPNKVSFLLWSIAPMIAFAAQLSQGVGLESLMTFSTGFLPFLTFGASFASKGARWKLSLFDFACGGLSLVGFALWMITKVGNLAILFSIIADGLAALPTLRKAYLHPETELAWPWLATCVGVVITLLTLDELTFANSGFILYIFVVDLLIYVCAQFEIGKRAMEKGRP